MFDAKKTKNDIIKWTKDYFYENGRNCHAVIGISGGKDSSVTAALCTAALGHERVFGVLIPNGEQNDINIAMDLVNYLNINHCIVNIKSSVDTLFEAITKSGQTVNKQSKINTPARIRMTVLYSIAASINGRVANTCNLSEDWVGYSTKFGDSAGDFSLLANLTVTEVKMVGKELGLPTKFVDKVPLDGLSGFTDEENLGFTYDVLDKYIREGICDVEDTKNKIDWLHKSNLHKLAPMPSYKPS